MGGKVMSDAEIRIYSSTVVLKVGEKEYLVDVRSDGRLSIHSEQGVKVVEKSPLGKWVVVQ
jgi:hypothetical protein